MKTKTPEKDTTSPAPCTKCPDAKTECSTICQAFIDWLHTLAHERLDDQTVTVPCSKCGQLITVPAPKDNQDLLSAHHIICPTKPHLFAIPTQKHTQLSLTVKEPRRN